jgi:hypothetical protein
MLLAPSRSSAAWSFIPWLQRSISSPKARHTHNNGRELGPEDATGGICVQGSWLGLARSIYRGASNATHRDVLNPKLQVLNPDLRVRLFLSSTFTDTVLERNYLMAMVWPEVRRPD